MSKVVVFVANGVEESEALVSVDILRRAGNDVDIVSVTEDKNIESTNNIHFIADKSINEIDDFDDYDMILIPGGMPGVDNIYACQKVIDAIVDFNLQGKNIAAICAGPAILGRLGILEGKQAIAAPHYIDELKGATKSIEDPITYGNITTASGMGHVIPFTLQLVNVLQGMDVSTEVAEKIGYNMY